MNILVTGHTGFIGSHLCERLSKEHDLFFLIRPHSEKDILGDNGKTFIFVEDNILELHEFIYKNKIDGIIHLASLYIQRHIVTDVNNLIKTNIFLGTAILEAAYNTDIKWFINTGTIWQNYNVPPYSEIYNPVNLYAATKQAFIDIAKYYVDISNIRFCTIKLCDTYGPNDTRRKIYSLFEENAKTGEKLKMSPGEQRIDILHIDKVVDGFVKLIHFLEKNVELRDEYVLTSGNHYTLKELARRYEKDNDVKLNIEWGALPYRNREVMIPYIGHKIPNM